MKHITFIFIFIFLFSTNSLITPNSVLGDEKTGKEVVTDLFNDIKNDFKEQNKEKIFDHFSDNLQVNYPDFLEEQEELINSLFEMKSDEIKYSFEIKKVMEKVINKKDVIIALVYTAIRTEKALEDETAWYYIDDDKFEIYKIELIDDDDDDNDEDDIISTSSNTSTTNYNGKLPANSPPESNTDSTHTANDEKLLGKTDNSIENQMPSEFANEDSQNNSIPTGITDSSRPKDPNIDYSNF
jgi:uncharacterized membrane protein YheB (UPF0754 family)